MEPIAQSSIVAALDWIHRQYPQVTSASDISDKRWMQIIGEYELSHKRPLDIAGMDRLKRKWASAFWTISQKNALNAISSFAYYLELRSRDNSQDLIQRYKSIPNRMMFFFTDEDREFRDYVSNAWVNLDELSGDACDIYVCTKELSGAYGGYKRLETLSTIPGVSDIQVSDFPCALLWSVFATVLLPLRHIAQDRNRMRDFLRDLFGRIYQLQGPLTPKSSSELREWCQFGLPPGGWSVPKEDRDWRGFDVFISYKRRVRNAVEAIAETLRAEGLTVWFDRRLEPGDPFGSEISLALRSARSVLVAWTPDAFPKGGDMNGWVIGEATIARERRNRGEATYVPVLIEQTDLDPPFNTDNAVSLVDWVSKDTEERRGDAEWRRIVAAIALRPTLA